MADFQSIAATGKSIERVLQACFEEDEPAPPSKTKARLIRSEDFEGNGITRPAVSVFLYRVGINGVMRAAWSAVGSLDGRAHLPVDLHFLLTAWANNAEHEQQILGRAMQCLEMRPVLSGPVLYPGSNWAPNEAVQVMADDVSTDTLMRTFDSLDAGFRLSVAYIARIVRIDGTTAAPSPPVTTVIAGGTPSLTP